MSSAVKWADDVNTGTHRPGCGGNHSCRKGSCNSAFMSSCFPLFPCDFHAQPGCRGLCAITQPGFGGTVSPRFKPFLRAEPRGRVSDGRREAGARGPEATCHPASFDNFPIGCIAPVSQGSSTEEGEGRRRRRRVWAGLASQAYGPFTVALWGTDGWPGCLCLALLGGFIWPRGPQLLFSPLR